MKNKLNAVLEWVKKRERYLSPVAFLAGFIWDSLTLTRIDLWLNNLAFLSYLAVAGAGIVALNAYWSGSPRMRFLDRYAEFLSLPIQFAFGGLFSGFFIFYSRSGALAQSLPFLLFLAVLLLGNEFFRRRYFRLSFQIAIFFIAIFSYAVFFIPVVLGKMGAEIFLLSGIVALAAIGAVLWLIARVSRIRFRQSRRMLFSGVAGIYLLFNLLYFTNIIPPIPLALKEIGVYHSVRRVGDLYEVKFEPAPRYIFWRETDSTFRRVAGRPVYVYSAVFAPTKLNTPIFHRWSYRNKEKGAWIATDRLSYRIVGGRDGGYRGFTFKQNLMPGSWRVDVETERGQILGRVKFEVVEVSELPELKTATR